MITSLITLTLIAMTPQNFIEPGAEIKKLPGTYRFTEGPCWTKQNTLIFSDIPASIIYEFDGKEVKPWRTGTNGANGNTIDSKGNVYTCEHTSRSVTLKSGDQIKTIAAEFNGKKLNSPNDIAIHPTGRIVFTDPSYGIRPAQMEQDGKYVYELHNGTLIQLYKGRNQPNGLVFSPDGKKLYVADSGSGGIEIFDYQPGQLLTSPTLFQSPGPDGIRVDTEGRVWAACGDGVNIYSPNGEKLQNIKFPEQPANLCFGDQDGKTLFVTARTGVYSLRLNVTGIKPGF
jgi:gluconolactonase